MRTVTAAERGYIGGLRPQSWAKLEITNESGVYIDYTAGLLGPDFVNSLQLEENIDSNCMRLSGSLLRCSGTLSLSPFMSSSLLNLTSGSYATKLDIWRKWKISVAVSREGYPPTGSDWKELVQGRVDVINIVGDEIQISGRSEEAVLLQKWISTERQYGSVGGIAIETVMQSMLDDNLGTSVVTLYCPVSPSFNMNVWVQPKGNLMQALTAVAEKAGMVLRYRYDSSNVYKLTLLKPNRSATVEDWSLGPSEYTSVPLNKIDLSGVRNFIKVRFADATLGTQTVISPWQAGTGTVACTAGVATFSTSQASFIRTSSGRSTEIIVAGVAYTITAFNGTTGATLLAQLQSGGTPTFTASAFTLSDTLSGNGRTTSLDRFDRIDMEIDLSYTSQVNNATNAQGFADAVRGDMEFPNLEQQFETPGFWFVQLYDYGRFYANNVHYDTDQLAGITSIRHDISQGSIKSTIGARGKPAGRYMTWKVLSQITAPSASSGTTLPRRNVPYLEDGQFAARATDTTGQTLHSGVTDSFSRPVIKSLAKASSADPDTLDGVPDGSTYLRIAGVSAGHQIQTASIAALAITAAKIANATITTSQIAAAAAITGAQIAAATIGAANIVANAITAAQIAANTITAAQIAAHTVTAGEIAALTITAAEIAAGTITAAKITAGTITATEIAAATILAANIVTGTITPLQVQGRNRCKVVVTGSPVQTTGTTPTVFTAWTESAGAAAWDVGGIHDDSVNPSRLTIPANGSTGTWLLSASMSFGFNATGDRWLAIYKNGSAVSVSNIRATSTSSNSTVFSVFFFDNVPSVGDYYEVFIWQNSGSTLGTGGGTSESYFSAVHLW